MTLTRKDTMATVSTLLVVLIFAATHEGWGVPLVGSSHRWAVVVVTLLGVLACALGSPGKDEVTTLLTGLGVIAFALTLVALAFNSLTVLSLLVADIVLLWALSTLRHAGVLHLHGRLVAR